MSRISLSLALSAALLPGVAFGEDTTVYKSRGASGETVYSQVETENASQHKVGVDEGTPAAADGEAPAPAKSSAELACERARLNLEVLTSDKKVTFDRDGDGKPEEMSDEERARDSDLAKRQVAAYCAPPPTAED